VDDDQAVLVMRLRAAGCVFADEEAKVLWRAAANAAQLVQWSDRRVAGEPLEHIVGSVEFGGHDLAVGPGLFIPRQRTRLVAAIASDEVGAALRRDPAGALFVEAYGGVGPIAAVVRGDHPGVAIGVTDIDPAALAYVRTNVGEEARTWVGAGLGGLPDGVRGAVSVIAAVPPYVPVGERAMMPAEARDYEPFAAHSGGADGLAEIGQLLAQVPEWLMAGGVLLVELHRGQVLGATGIAAAAGLDAAMVTGHRCYADDGQTAVLVVRSQMSFSPGPSPGSSG
jgi:release factor glutamine methyltransferase